MLVDVAKIKIKAGDGGRGKVSFRTSKHVAKGGPDGGNGGNGGDAFIVADHNLATLMDFRARDSYAAQDGAAGDKKNMTGAEGEDIRVKVPAGTLVYELRESEEILIGDLVKDGQELLVASGGRGGRGNTSFKSSTNQTPRQFTPGKKGEEKELRFEVKLIADVGLIGFPNAGKSTLINKLTSSNAKVGSYPFTTLTPNLGVCVLSDGKEVVVADIPGLIEGASTGKGLGDDFLRHVERTRLLVHVIDPTSVFSSDLEDVGEAVWKKYVAIRKELGDYNENLLEKEEVVVINKLDMPQVLEAFEEIKGFFKSKKVSVVGISAITGEGIDLLRTNLIAALERVPEIVSFETETPVKIYTIENLPNRRVVFKEPSVEE